jgi:homoserine dehydrogenase
LVQVNLAFIGFGKVAREFARILDSRRALLEDEYGIEWRVTGIATASHGVIVRADGIDLAKALRLLEAGDSLNCIEGDWTGGDALEFIGRVEADIVFETTPLDPVAGEPAVGYIEMCLDRGINVVTANKGPVAFAYRRLKALAESRGVGFRFEGTVMDGAPIFNMVDRCLPATRLIRFAGILNSTTNLILSGIETGQSFDVCLEEARRLGILETDPDFDIDGWDAAVKAVALANVLMDVDLRPADVERVGIRLIDPEYVRAAAREGKAFRLVARGGKIETGARITVRPEIVERSSVMGLAKGTTNVLVIQTDLMGETVIVEESPGLQQTAYALLSDMIGIHDGMNRKK